MSQSKFSEIETPRQFLPIVQMAVERAKKHGAQFADAVISLGRDIAVTVDKSSIKSSQSGWERSFSIRVFVNGGMGYTSTTSLESHEIETLVDRAIELAKIATPDSNFVATPSPQVAPHVPAVFDPQVLTLGPADAIRWASENIREAQGVFPEVIVSGDVGIRVSSRVMASSTGIALDRKSTSVYSGFFCVVKDDGTVGSFADHANARFLSDFVPTGLGRKATTRAMAYRHAKKVHTGHTTLVLGPMPAHGLAAGLAHAAGAESIQRKRSLLANRGGDQIASEILSITDNGIIDRGLSSAAYDGEGAVKKVVRIIENGKFANQLHNSYTAHKIGVPNTGHGTRTRGVSHSNLEVRLGSQTEAELIREVKDGIYLELGGLDPDLASGDISTNLDFAFKIENGELAYPVSNTMVGGNLREMLMNIDAISSDYREEPGNKMPSMRIRNVQISSGGE
jgi:PmbA protein